MDVRIIGISPIVTAINPETQEMVGLKIYFGCISQNVDMYFKTFMYLMERMILKE